MDRTYKNTEEYMLTKELQVSIVVVCMNNLKNLYPCLEGIRKYTTVSYETLVVAYLFSKENFEKVKRDFPWVTFIESNEIRGFSENNNLALRQAKGKYCYVLNDDTLMDTPVIDSLVETFERMPEDVAVVSPNIKFPDGRPQYCGRKNATFWIFMKRMFFPVHSDSQYVYKTGIFETYNISGAAFLIKTNVFRAIGYFDEYYFFCPEDIAVSTLLRKKGYKCMVNADINQYHIQGGTWSVLQTATDPAHYKGLVRFYCGESLAKKTILTIFFVIRSIFRASIWGAIWCFSLKKKAKYKAVMYINVIRSLFSSKTPKEIFVLYYDQIKR